MATNSSDAAQQLHLLHLSDEVLLQIVKQVGKLEVDYSSRGVVSSCQRHSCPPFFDGPAFTRPKMTGNHHLSNLSLVCKKFGDIVPPEFLKGVAVRSVPYHEVNDWEFSPNYAGAYFQLKEMCEDVCLRGMKDKIESLTFDLPYGDETNDKTWLLATSRALLRFIQLCPNLTRIVFNAPCTGRELKPFVEAFRTLKLPKIKTLVLGQHCQFLIASCPNVTEISTKPCDWLMEIDYPRPGELLLQRAGSSLQYLTHVNMEGNWTADLLSRVAMACPGIESLGLLGGFEGDFGFDEMTTMLKGLRNLKELILPGGQPRFEIGVRGACMQSSCTNVIEGGCDHEYEIGDTYSKDQVGQDMGNLYFPLMERSGISFFRGPLFIDALDQQHFNRPSDARFHRLGKLMASRLRKLESIWLKKTIRRGDDESEYRDIHIQISNEGPYNADGAGQAADQLAAAMWDALYRSIKRGMGCGSWVPAEADLSTKPSVASVVIKQPGTGKNLSKSIRVSPRLRWKGPSHGVYPYGRDGRLQMGPDMEAWEFDKYVEDYMQISGPPNFYEPWNGVRW